MTSNDFNWRFYGRRKELAELHHYLARPSFAVLAVTGGRGVGKTMLIEEALQTLPMKRSSVYVEIPSLPGQISRQELDDERQSFQSRFFQATVEAGLGSVAAEMRPSDDAWLPLTAKVEAVLPRLLRAGAIVVIDEFQFAKPLRLVNSVKWVIDRLKNDPSVSGKIVIAGSHQQDMSKLMEDPKEDLYLRINNAVHLAPLKLPEIFEMAAEQGWLDKPYRLLAAYTAFGGQPRRWRWLKEEQQNGRIAEPPGRLNSAEQDRVWRRRLMLHLADRLRKDVRERFDYTAFMTLPENARRIARHLALHPRGLASEHVFRECGRRSLSDDEIEEALDTLIRRLRLVEWTGSGPDAVSKLRMRDQAAMFELAVLAPLTVPQSASFVHRDKPLTDEDFDLAVESVAGGERFPAISKASGIMSEFEGYSLERLAEEYIRSAGKYSWIIRGCVLSRSQQTEWGVDDDLSLGAAGWKAGSEIEIDIGAGNYTDEGKTLRMLASCKRDPKRQRVRDISAKFTEFAHLFDREAKGNSHDEPLRKLLISPEWPDDLPAPKGFERVGFSDMAQSLGLKIRPWTQLTNGQRLYHSPDTEPPARSEPDDSYDFGM